MKTLLAFSAGFDSTYLLHRLLGETADTVHCFWMDTADVKIPGHPTVSFRSNAEAERASGAKIIQWMNQQLRPVTFEVVHVETFEPWGWRVPAMIYWAAGKMQSGFDRFWWGRSPDNIRNRNSEARDLWYKEWWTRIAPAGAVMETPLIDWWHGRQHAIASLPAELQALISACNYPTVIDGNAKDCGACDKCLMVADTKRLLAEGCSPGVVLDYHLRLRRAGPYIDSAGSGEARFGADGRDPHWVDYRDREGPSG